MDKSDISCPFAKARLNDGFGKMDDQDDPVLMVLRHKDVRRSAHNWKTFQSGAKPGRIVVPSEVNIRDVRQIPFEVDPPLHGAYRAVLEQWFRRPLDENYTLELKSQITSIIDSALSKNNIEVISDLALVMQSRALTLLLNVPIEEAETWISWGTHVFRSEESAVDADKANILYDYIDDQIQQKIDNPGTDLYSQLLSTEVNGEKLTKEEVKGVMILTFAGGRDTVINATSNTIAYFADHPESLERLRQEPELIKYTIEELIRYFSPLTHMGRVATEDSQVCGHMVEADTRISLNWASANRDSSVFDNADEVVIDRKINPHVAFGFGTHNCLGATHARQIMKVLIQTLIDKVESIEIIDCKENIETLGDFERKVGFDKLNVKFTPKK